MATTDGSVLHMTQVFGNAPRNRAFNVVLLAEGFTAVQQNDFDTACMAFVNALLAIPPFDALAPAINVFRVNVASTDAGADDPVAAGGTGATARTYFDATFGGNNIRRLLVCNALTALQVAAAQVPEFTVVLVIVNSTIYGGSGGSVGTYSLANGATEIAIHEMGHTAFGLADEYACYACDDAETGHDHHPAGEPREPNVTTNQDRNTLKWRWAVAEATAIPTMSNPDCSTVDGRPSPVPAGAVGLFEGANHYHCGAFRPEYSCKMQALSIPFCRVCRQVIEDRIGPLVTGWRHANLTAATGAPGAGGDPAGYTWDVDGTQHVVYRGTDGHIHELWFHLNSGWGHANLTAATGAPGAGGDPAGYTWDVDGTQHVVYRGTDGHIHELWFHLNSGWGHANLTLATGAPGAGGDPAGYTWDVDGTQHVVYRGTDGHIHELWFHLNSGWGHANLTAATGAPGAGGDPAGYTWDVDGTQHVVYRGTDGHIHELWFHLNSGWGHANLTLATGAPGAGGDPAGYTWDVDGTQHVVYRGTDGHIHELWFHLNSGWGHANLTAATGAPGAGGDPAGYTWDVDGTQHLVYRGTDGHIHELWFHLNSGWGHANLTLATGAPGAGGDPAGYTWDVDRTQHVVYSGTDGHIHELWFHL